MNLIQESYQRLFPDKQFNYKTKIEYNRRLSPFNANITRSSDEIKINVNLQWKNIDDEIKIGLMQHLLTKIFKSKRNTPNIELYHNFLKQIPSMTPKTKTDFILEKSFNRVNEQFFGGGMQQPNLQWGKEARRKLASYNYQSDMVTVSNVYKNASQQVLDYLMYHELLHKHFQFTCKNGRSTYHSREFKEAERLFPNQKEVEQETHKLARKKKFSFFR